eukprot:761547-Hanusia_phi.AAC.1
MDSGEAVGFDPLVIPTMITYNSSSTFQLSIFHYSTHSCQCFDRVTLKQSHLFLNLPPLHPTFVPKYRKLCQIEPHEDMSEFLFSERKSSISHPSSSSSSRVVLLGEKRGWLGAWDDVWVLSRSKPGVVRSLQEDEWVPSVEKGGVGGDESVNGNPPDHVMMATCADER